MLHAIVKQSACTAVSYTAIVLATHRLRMSRRLHPRSTGSTRLPQPFQHVADHREENIALHIIVVHQIDEVVGVLNGVYHPTGLGALRVEFTPVGVPQCKGFVLGGGMRTREGVYGVLRSGILVRSQCKCTDSSVHNVETLKNSSLVVIVGLAWVYGGWDLAKTH